MKTNLRPNVYSDRSTLVKKQDPGVSGTPVQIPAVVQIQDIHTRYVTWLSNLFKLFEPQLPQQLAHYVE